MKELNRFKQFLNEEIEMVKPGPGHKYYKLNKDVVLDVLTGATSATGARGVMLNPLFDKQITAKKGQYIIDFSGQYYYVDMDGKFATKVPRHEDSDNMKNLRGAIDPVDMAPKFRGGWDAYLKNFDKGYVGPNEGLEENDKVLDEILNEDLEGHKMSLELNAKKIAKEIGAMPPKLSKPSRVGSYYMIFPFESGTGALTAMGQRTMSGQQRDISMNKAKQAAEAFMEFVKQDGSPVDQGSLGIDDGVASFKVFLAPF